jgi:hypothetical protein
MMDLMVVRRTFTPAYYFFLRAFAKANGLRIMLDRRKDERRAQPSGARGERRRNERRRAYPSTWHKGDFIIVEPLEVQPELSGFTPENEAGRDSAAAPDGHEAGIRPVLSSDEEMRIGDLLGW